MTMTDPLPRFFKELEAQCDYCSKKVILTFKYGNNLQPGSKLWSDPERPDFGRCPQCNRKSMTVLRVAEVQRESGEPHPGFWKPPPGAGSSST